MTAVALALSCGVRSEGGEVPQSASEPSSTQIVASYLGSRWVLTGEKPVVVVCTSVGREVQDSITAGLPGLVQRVAVEVSAASCDSNTTSAAFSEAGAVLMIQSIVPDIEMPGTGVLRAVGDSRRGYRVLEVFRFSIESGAPVSLLFTGFEEYHT